MAKGGKLCARCYVNTILTPIWRRLIPDWKHKLVIQADKSRRHAGKVAFDFASQKKVRFVAHAASSPAVVLSDFFLVDFLKHEFSGRFSVLSRSFFAEVSGLAEPTPSDALAMVFDECIERGEHVIAADGDDFELAILCWVRCALLSNGGRDTPRGAGSPFL
jgi:hypothetical protein